MFRRDRGIGRGGGLLVYLKNCLKCKLIEWPAEIDIECIGLNITISPEMSFTLICLHRPPSSKNTFYDQLKTVLKYSDFKRGTILLGDFNINWDNKLDRKKLKQLTDNHNLTQVIQGPTRITNTSKTTIDLIFTNKSDRISTTFNLLSGLSDHNLILCSRKVNWKHSTSLIRASSYQIIPKTEQQNLTNALQEYDWLNVLTNNEAEDSCSIFSKCVKEILDSFTKKVKFKRRKKALPWVKDDVWKLMKERDNALKKSLKTGLICDRQIFTSLRNKVIKLVRKAKADFFIKMIDGANGNGKLIWEQLNKLTGRNKKDIIPNNMQLQVNGMLTSDLGSTVNSFNNFFIQSIEELTMNFECPDTSRDPLDDSKPVFNLREITVPEVLEIISSLECSKARDVFGLDSNLLKHHKLALTHPIAHLINLSINQNSVPSAWKIAKVTPVLKAGDKTKLEN